jgi:hypothetical protein
MPWVCIVAMRVGALLTFRSGREYGGLSTRGTGMYDNARVSRLLYSYTSFGEKAN